MPLTYLYIVSSDVVLLTVYIVYKLFYNVLIMNNLVILYEGNLIIN
jgi:hypothetical protein